MTPDKRLARALAWVIVWRRYVRGLIAGITLCVLGVFVWQIAHGEADVVGGIVLGVLLVVAGLGIRANVIDIRETGKRTARALGGPDVP